MSYFNDESMYREIIIDHTKNPRNIKKPNDDYKKAYLKKIRHAVIEITLYVLYDEKENKVKE